MRFTPLAHFISSAVFLGIFFAVLAAAPQSPVRWVPLAIAAVFVIGLWATSRGERMAKTPIRWLAGLEIVVIIFSGMAGILIQPGVVGVGVLVLLTIGIFVLNSGDSLNLRTPAPSSSQTSTGEDEV